MGKRVCVFVDGENFRHTICDLFDSFDPKDYLPRRARWADFYDWLVEKASPGAERVRTYWYTIQWMDFFPYRLQRLRKDPQALRRTLNRHKPYRDELGKLGEPELSKRMDEIVEHLTGTQKRMQDRFNGWMAVQNGIAHRHRAIEFRRAGAIRCSLFDSSLGPEKAVDVKLATDLICLDHIYDTAIVVSGDQDYVPAVQVIKNAGKTTMNVAFKTRGGRLLPGGARRLNQETDSGLEVTYKDLAGFLAIPSAH